MDDLSKLHVSIEFNQLHKFGLINESQGHIGNIEYIAQEISDIILDYVECRGFKLYSTINFSDLVIYKSDISVDTFFDEIHFANSYCFLIDNMISAGSYHSDKSGMANKKYIVTLGIQYSSLIEYMEDSLAPLIAHELAHAYEDYQKNKNVSIVDKSCIKLSDTAKLKIYEFLQSSDPYIKNMAELLYFSFKDEVTAMKNEICDEIFLKRHYIKDCTAGIKILMNTEVYRRIKSMEAKVDFLKNCVPKKKSELQDTYNNIFGTGVSDFNIILRKIETGFINAKHDIIKAGCKYICSTFLVKNTDGYIRRGKKYK